MDEYEGIIKHPL